MFIAHYENTMRNAKPKFEEPKVVVRTIEQMRAEKRTEAQRLRREQFKALLARTEERLRIREEGHKAEMERQALERGEEYVPEEIPTTRKTPVIEIITSVADAHHLSVDAIISPRRDHRAVAARFDAIVAVRNEHPSLSLVQMGRIFKRDHSSVSYVLQTMAAKSLGKAS